MMHLICLLLLTLNTACQKNKTAERKVPKSEIVTPLKTDTLKFTSGVRAVFHDSKGNYWLGSDQEGVARFNGKTFEYFTTQEGLAHNQVRTILEGKSGRIWFETANGVSNYDGSKISKPVLTENLTPLNLQKSTDKDLWFSAGNQTGVYRYDGQHLNYLALPIPGDSDPNDSYFVTDISEGKNNIIWIATYPGIFKYDGNQFTLINEKTLGYTQETERLHIRSIFEDSKGRLWVGNNGIGILLKDNDTFINFSKKHSLIHPDSSRNGAKSPTGTLEHVFAIEEDAAGNIWFGDRDTGVWKYDGNTLENYTITSESPDAFIRTIYKDNDDKLWFGSTGGSVYTFNGNTFDKQF